MERQLAGNWWAIVVRGGAAVAFALLALISPPTAIAALVVLFGAYALVDGMFHLVAAYRASAEGRPWTHFAIPGVVGVAVGLVTFFWPDLTALALVLIVAFWAAVSGLTQIAAAIRLRKMIEHEWLLGLSGALSLTFGVLTFLRPVAGAVALAFWIGAFALLYGAVLIAAGLRLRVWDRSHRGELPDAGAMPRHA